MDVRLLTSQLFKMVSERGLATTCRNVLNHLDNRWHSDPFDVANRTDSGGLQALWNLDIASPNVRHGQRYQATTEAELVATLTALPVSPACFTFVDLGCGKGRTLLVASRLGFKEVIGVEFARELVEVAARNMIVGGAPDAQVVHADAADFVFPAGGLVIYLYNPFSEAVLARVLDRLRRQPPSALYLLYKTPRCARTIDDSGLFERVARATSAMHIAVWRGRAATGAGG